ncbi:flagellar biosynthesis protein FlhB [Alkalilimnicola sp. S0819]|uniref:flagellar biosynthesis protein FlhB n=1 Tax=Alkalilimnicola sp. S0819 TaxID=2613922 RepID=UPI0012614DEE|nr:flagellar biosynthesis protein FlhB [Alkalilimnicola sp. S0819]KAB7627167.1 flagellar biosynthesis protein FlhB [Alkalilimnicola sp. S0819]MPQ15878.1 flagellar biosynthesis protein FlhB [Alkalilimnicola sp. S0819]
MAEENQDGQEKTEDPTPKRRQDAKDKGQVPRSQELNVTLLTLAAASALLVFGPYMGASLMDLIGEGLRVDRAVIFDPDGPFKQLRAIVAQGLWLIAPFALVMLLVALLSPVLLGGWVFSGKGLQPKLEKLNPLKGLKRIFGPQGLMNLVKALAKVLVVGGVGTMLLWSLRDNIALLGTVGLMEGVALAAKLLFGSFFALAAALILVAAVDVPWQIYSHTKKLRMTKQELKDEFKDTEGKPEVKGKIRQLQQQIAQGRMMEKVPEADVVVTNPTHFAVALKYDQAGGGAPVVVAKGVDEIAKRIREIAGEHRVPLFEAPPLARALYRTTKLEQEIPAGLYLAVAQVLAYIYQLRGAVRAQGERPTRPNPDIPEEFQQYAQRDQGSADP